jgi:hypothetical protein
MEGFEDFGKALEAELEHLRRFVTDEFVPHTRRAAVEALRTASARLIELADDLETRSGQARKQPGDPAPAKSD